MGRARNENKAIGNSSVGRRSRDELSGPVDEEARIPFPDHTAYTPSISDEQKARSREIYIESQKRLLAKVKANMESRPVPESPRTNLGHEAYTPVSSEESRQRSFDAYAEGQQRLFDKLSQLD